MKRDDAATRSPFLTVGEAAEYLRLRPRTLDNMRWSGSGPKFHKHGGRVVYQIDDLMRWSATGGRVNTSGGLPHGLHGDRQ